MWKTVGNMLQEPFVMTRVKPESATCKLGALTPLLALQPHDVNYFYLFILGTYLTILRNAHTTVHALRNYSYGYLHAPDSYMRCWGWHPESNPYSSSLRCLHFCSLNLPASHNNILQRKELHHFFPHT